MARGVRASTPNGVPGGRLGREGAGSRGPGIGERMGGGARLASFSLAVADASGPRWPSAVIASWTEKTVAHSLHRILAVGLPANLSSAMRYLVSHLGQWNLITFARGQVVAVCFGSTREPRQKSRCR